MKRICKLIGSICLGVAALIAVIGPTSLNSISVEEMPESIKNKR